MNERHGRPGEEGHAPLHSPHDPVRRIEILERQVAVLREVLRQHEFLLAEILRRLPPRTYPRPIGGTITVKG